MPQPNSVLATACLALIALLGCSKQREDAEKMAAAAKAISDIAQQGQKAEKAAAEAEKAARAQMAPGTDPAAAQQQVDIAKSMAAMKAMGGGGPAVNWRQLAPLLPDAVLDFKAKGELDGKTTKAAGFEISEVSRRYETADSDLRIQITDTSANAMLRAPFAMVAMVEEDSTQGFKRGTQIRGQPAIVEWKAKAKSSTVSLLVAQRFVVNVRVSKADSDGDAEAVAAALKLDDLAKLAAAAPAPAQAAK